MGNAFFEAVNNLFRFLGHAVRDIAAEDHPELDVGSGESSAQGGDSPDIADTL